MSFPITLPVFSTPLDNVSTTVAVARSIGGSTLQVATGTGSLFGSPSSSNPVRITVIRKVDSARVHFSVTNVSGDVLTVTTTDGYEDISQNFNDTVQVLVSAGTVLECQVPITAAITGVNYLAANPPVGPQGPQGATGSGSQGTQGSTGSQGPQGFQGNTGATGSQGTQGHQGFQGNAGATGSQGSAGTQGATGSGSQGATGSQGPQGNQGFQGTVGTPAGSSGSIQYNNGSGALSGAGHLNSNAEMILGSASSTVPLVCLTSSSTAIIMTSNITPAPYTASASSIAHPGATDPWNAFDGNTGTVWESNTATNEWLQIDFGIMAEVVLTQYSITSYQTSSSPASWTFAGSNDGTTFTTLDTQAGQTFTGSQTKSYGISGGSYRYYRLTVLTNNGQGWIDIAELAFTGTALTSILSVSSGALNTPFLAALSNSFVTPFYTADSSGVTTAGEITCATASVGYRNTMTFSDLGVINLPTTVSSYIGGAGGFNPWIGYAVTSTTYFTDSIAADICYQNLVGRLLFGAPTSFPGLSQLQIDSTSINMSSVSTSVPTFTIEATSGQTADLTQWKNSTGSPLSGVDVNGCVRQAITSGTPSTTPGVGTTAFDPATKKLWVYSNSGWVSTTLS